MPRYRFRRLKTHCKRGHEISKVGRYINSNGKRGECKACVRQAGKLRYARLRNNPDFKQRRRAYKLKQNYGLSLEEYTAMLATQGGICAICGKPPKVNSLFVDHEHSTGRVRELLCYACNLRVGMLEGPLVDETKSYIEKWRRALGL